MFNGDLTKQIDLNPHPICFPPNCKRHLELPPKFSLTFKFRVNFLSGNNSTVLI